MSFGDHRRKGMVPNESYRLESRVPAAHEQSHPYMPTSSDPTSAICKFGGDNYPQCAPAEATRSATCRQASGVCLLMSGACNGVKHCSELAYRGTETLFHAGRQQSEILFAARVSHTQDDILCG